MSSKKSKAQITSTEFLIVSVVLISIVVVAVTMWNTALNRNNEKTVRDEMELLAITVSDNLLKSQGMPTNWEKNTTKIFSVGLAKENYVLDENKVSTFVNLSYNQLQSLLGIGNYDFYFRMVYPSGNYVGTKGITTEVVAYMAQQDPEDIVIRNLLNNSDLVWDFYWGKTTQPPYVTARNVYVGDKVQVYRWMVNNISAYNTIISEDSHVKQSDLSATQQQALRDFVSSDHTYYHVQHPEEFLAIFGLNPTAYKTDKGTVVEKDDALHDVAIGQNFVFEQDAKTFDISSSPLTLKTIMKATNDATKCVFCRWAYGNGRVYFIPDSSNLTKQPIQELDIVGKRMVAGKRPSPNSMIINSRRIVLFRDEIVYMDFMVWK